MSKKLYYLNIPPSTREIKALIEATNMDLKICVAELIANSLDQDSTHINLNLDKLKAVFRISDDGNGCHALEKMIKIGSHVPSKKDPVGRFGVGFKDAVIWLGDYVTVDSMTRSGKKQYALADWQEMMAVDDWNVGFSDDSSRQIHGVTVTVTGLRGRRFKAWGQVPRYISELFSAAIDAGVEITVDGKPVKSVPQPLLIDSVGFSGNFSGLAFKGVAGILVDKKAAVSGWDIRYSPQTICIGYAKDGFGEYSHHGFYGRFYMLDDEREWKLNRNKTGSEDLTDVLNCNYIQDIIRPILEKLKVRGDNLIVRMNQADVQTCLTKLLEKAKVSLSEETEEGGDRKTNRNPGPNPNEKNNQQKKQRKKRNPDPKSDIKEKINKAQILQIFPIEDPGKGLGYVSESDGGSIVKIFIDRSTNIGQRIWSDRRLLLHQAVQQLAIYFGLRVNILQQLRLPIGDLGMGEELKIAKTALYLFENADLDQFETAISAA